MKSLATLCAPIFVSILVSMTCPMAAMGQTKYCPLYMLSQADGVNYYYCLRCPPGDFTWLATNTTVGADQFATSCDNCPNPLFVRPFLFATNRPGTHTPEAGTKLKN